MVESLKDEFPELSKSLIKSTIKDIASKEKSVDGYGSYRWVVKPNVATEFKMEVFFNPVLDSLHEII